MVPNYQKSNFWARDLRFIPDVCFYNGWKDLDSKLPNVYSKVPKKVQKGPKRVQKGSKRVQKSVFWARDLRFTPDVYFYDWWKNLESKLPKVYSKVPKRGPKGSKNGPKRFQKSVFWTRDLRFIPDVCFCDWSKELESKLPKVYSKVPKMGPKGSKKDPKRVQNLILS